MEIQNYIQTFKLYPTGSIIVNHNKYLLKKLQFYLGIGEQRQHLTTMIPIDMEAKTTIIPRNMRAKMTIDDNNDKGIGEQRRHYT